MSDIFQEVEEEVRRERANALWKKYQNWVIAAALLIILGVAGWRGYESWQQKIAGEAGARYLAAMDLAREGKTAEAEEAFNRIAAEGTATYRLLARLRGAAETANRDKAAAVNLYDQIAADSGAGLVFQDLARLKAATLLVDTAPLADVLKRVEPLTVPANLWRNNAREVAMLAAFKAGDAAAVQKWSEAILTDPAASQGQRNRVELIRLVMAGQTPAAK